MNNAQLPPLLHEAATPTQMLVNSTLSSVRRQHTSNRASKIATGPLRSAFLLEIASPEDLPTLLDLLARAG